MQEASWIALRC